MPRGNATAAAVCVSDWISPEDGGRLGYRLGSGTVKKCLQTATVSTVAVLRNSGLAGPDVDEDQLLGEHASRLARAGAAADDVDLRLVPAANLLLDIASDEALAATRTMGNVRDMFVALTVFMKTQKFTMDRTIEVPVRTDFHKKSVLGRAKVRFSVTIRRCRGAKETRCAAESRRGGCQGRAAHPERPACAAARRACPLREAGRARQQAGHEQP